MHKMRESVITKKFYSFGEQQEVNDTNAHAMLTESLRGHIGVFQIDVRKSKGSYAFIPKENRHVLDMNQSLSSRPLSYNHPIFNDEDYKELVTLYTANKLSYSTYYNTDIAKATKIIQELYVNPSGFDHIFYIAGGAKSVEVAVHIAIIKNTGDEIIKRNFCSILSDAHSHG